MRLIDAPVGLFMSKEGEMCLKTEYIADWGVEAYIVSSGETYWGGVKTAEERNNLEVTPIDAVPVVPGQWVPGKGNLWACSRCGAMTVSAPNCNPVDEQEFFCYRCGARMDGGGGDES